MVVMHAVAGLLTVIRRCRTLCWVPPMPFSNLETRTIRYLAESFAAGQLDMGRGQVRAHLAVSDQQAEVLLRTMESLGAIERVTSAQGAYAEFFRPTFRVVQLCREMDAASATRPDFVEQIQRRFKQNPVLAWIIMVFLLLAFAAPIYSMIVDFGERIGWFAVPGK